MANLQCWLGDGSVGCIVYEYSKILRMFNTFWKLHGEGNLLLKDFSVASCLSPHGLLQNVGDEWKYREKVHVGREIKIGSSWSIPFFARSNKVRCTLVIRARLVGKCRMKNHKTSPRIRFPIGKFIRHKQSERENMRIRKINRKIAREHTTWDKHKEQFSSFFFRKCSNSSGIAFVSTKNGFQSRISMVLDFKEPISDDFSLVKAEKLWRSTETSNQ